MWAFKPRYQLLPFLVGVAFTSAILVEPPNPLLERT